MLLGNENRRKTIKVLLRHENTNGGMIVDVYNNDLIGSLMA